MNKHTPLVGLEITEIIGFGETTKTTDEIMNGTADIEKLTDNNPTSQSFLKYSNFETKTQYQY